MADIGRTRRPDPHNRRHQDLLQNSSGFPDKPSAGLCQELRHQYQQLPSMVFTVDGNSSLHQYLNINGTETSVSPRDNPTGSGRRELRPLEAPQPREFILPCPCGMNGALPLEMSATGTASALNPAGAAYGTGYTTLSQLG